MTETDNSLRRHIPDALVPDASMKIPLTVGLGVAGVAGLLAFVTSNMAASEGKILLEAAMPSMRFMSSAIATASATVVGLMLTLLGLSRSMEIEFGGQHYERIESIARLSCVSFAGSVVFLLILTLPIQDPEKLPFEYYDELYTVFMIISTALAATLTAVVLMLYQEVVDLVQAVHPEADTPQTAESSGASESSDAAESSSGQSPEAPAEASAEAGAGG